MQTNPSRAPSQPAGSAADVHLAGAEMHLFVVERRLPAMTQRGLTMLHAALTDAADRYRGRGEPIAYVRSIFIPRQQRMLSLFLAPTLDLVQDVNEAALAPFTSIEQAVEFGS